MKWLPARLYVNGIYVVFSNPIGMDDDQLKNSCSMIIDPLGDILTGCRSFDNEVAAATCVPEKLEASGATGTKGPEGLCFTGISSGRITVQRCTLHGCERYVKKASSQVSIPLSAARQTGFMPSLVRAKS